jgi:hypothetical protein
VRLAYAAANGSKGEDLPSDRPGLNRRRRVVRGRVKYSQAVPWIQLAIAAWIIVLWSIAQLKATFDSTFHPPESITAVTLLAAGFLFGSALFKTRDSKDGRDDD